MAQSTEMSVYERGLVTFKEIQEKAKTLQVTDETVEYAGETLVIAKRLASVLDTERLEEGSPHYERYKEINNRFNAIIKPCQDIAASIEKKIAAFNRAKREEAERQRLEYERKVREAEEKRLAEERRQKEEYERQLREAEKKRQAEIKKAEKKGVEPPPPLVIPAPPPPVAVQVPVPPPPVAEAPQEKFSTAFGSAKVKGRWTYTEVDINKVPREWLMLDEKKVLKAINQPKLPVRTIPGLDIHPEV